MTHKELAEQLQIFRNAWVAGKGVFRDSWGDGILTQAIAALEADFGGEPLAEGWALRSVIGAYADDKAQAFTVFRQVLGAPDVKCRVAIYGVGDA